MRTLLRRVSGNPSALARLFVIALLLGTGISLALFLHAPPQIMVGSFIGAALSLAVAGLVAALEDKGLNEVPVGILTAAKNDVHHARYYRDNQNIDVSVATDRDKNEIIELRFTSDIIPVDEHAKVEHPKIEPPPGVTLIDCRYEIGGSPVPKGGELSVPAKTSDTLMLRYRIDGNAWTWVKDDHLWPSPVLAYSVEFDLSSKHSFAVSKIAAGDKTEALRSETIRGSKILKFVGNGAAFSTQGIRWQLTRSK